MDSSIEAPGKHRHLSRQAISVCLMFTVLVFVLTSVVGYFSVRSAVMERYEVELGDVLQVVAAQIDVADLQECMESKEESEKLRELQAHMDVIRQNASFDYLVIVQPVKDGDDYDVLAVASGLLPGERAGASLREGMEIPKLGDSTGAAYDPDFVRLIYEDMVNREGVKFSSSATDYGETYDAAMSIRNAQGEGIALLTVGIESDTINATMARYITQIVVIALVIGIAFLVFMSMWLRKRVTGPVGRIESAAREFERKSADADGTEALVLDLSDIRSGDELESLARTLEAMSRDMRNYVDRLVLSANRIKGMEREIVRVSELAMQDALTGVRNKACFNEECERLDEGIADGTADFALLMVDLNDLKGINDTFGHDKGDAFIKAGCEAICRTFTHSPVFRIGGDEFAVLLEKGDLALRDALLGKLSDTMRTSRKREKWLRVSLAFGLAVYDPDVDASAADVLARADRAMYANKAPRR